MLQIRDLGTEPLRRDWLDVRRRLHEAETAGGQPSWPGIHEVAHALDCGRSHDLGQQEQSDPAFVGLPAALMLLLEDSLALEQLGQADPTPDLENEAPAEVLGHLQGCRSGRPASLHGLTQPLPLPEPLVGFVRAHEGERVLAVFNLAGHPARLDLADYASVRPLPGCGFAPDLECEAAILPGYGVFFARIVPDREWQEEAALAFG
jgi:hypothetical protein